MSALLIAASLRARNEQHDNLASEVENDVIERVAPMGVERAATLLKKSAIQVKQLMTVAGCKSEDAMLLALLRPCAGCTRRTQVSRWSYESSLSLLLRAMEASSDSDLAGAAKAAEAMREQCNQLQLAL